MFLNIKEWKDTQNMIMDLNQKTNFMEIQPKRMLRAAPPPLMLQPSQPIPPSPPPSPTGTRTPLTSPAEPRTPPPSPAPLRAPPPSPASPRAPPPSPFGAQTAPPSPQAPLTQALPLKEQECKNILPHVPMLGIPLLFWEKRKRDMEWMMNFNSLEMPLVRVKRMMKSDDPLSRVAGNVTAFFSKACVVFDAEKCHGHTWIANVGCNTIIIGGVYGVSDSLPNPIKWQRIPGVLKGLNSDSTGTSIGDLSDDAGRTGWEGMRYHYMPVPMNLFPLMEKGEVSSPRSSGILCQFMHLVVSYHISLIRS